MRISDWSSDVCSSDLKMPVVPANLADAERILRDGPWPLEAWPNGPSDPGGVVSSVFVEQVVLSAAPFGQRRLLDVAFTFGCLQPHPLLLELDRKSVVLGKSVSVRLDLGGRRII